MSARAKPAKAAPAKRAGARGKRNAGNFKKGDPRINYAGRPPGVLELRAMMRDVGEERALNTLLEAMKARGLNLGTAVRAANTWLTYATPELTTAPNIVEHTGTVRVNLSHLTDEELDLYERLATKARDRADPGNLPAGADPTDPTAQP